MHELHFVQARSSMVLCSAIIKRDVNTISVQRGIGTLFGQLKHMKKRVKGSWEKIEI